MTKSESDKLLARLRDIISAAEAMGVSASALCRKARVSPSTVNRKISGADKSVVKPSTLAKIEAALVDLGGNQVEGREALMTELNRADYEIAQSVDELVRVLVKRGVLDEAELPAHLRRNLTRRRHLLELLNLSEA